MQLDPGMDPVYLFNGGCARCGTGSPIYDTGVQVPYEGIFGFCGGCLADMAQDAGMVIADTVGASLLAASLARIEELETRLDAAEDILSRVKAATNLPRRAAK